MENIITTDEAIVNLYWDRNEEAIRITQEKYEKYLMKIAYSVLNDMQDSEESVNETYLKAWNSMPEQRPSILSTYLGKITRQYSIDIYRKRNREKRKSSEYAVSLSELEDCVTGGSTPEEELDVKLLAEAIESYLYTLKKDARVAFVMRYFYSDTLSEIAKSLGMTEAGVKSMLHRVRIGLRTHLSTVSEHSL
ncbi:MAG: sigma-70 family RNA polymerase sigma factor [Oscillospiraceae bacterium]|nr:sigma-70 family RNA polymerase sigma factor [Oscillospiraceae bacterium]